MMLSAEVVGDEPSVWELVEAGHVEPHRERLHRLACKLAHRAGDDARVYAAAEHGPHWHVSHHALLDGPMHMLANAGDVLFDRAPLGRAEGEIPVALLAHAAVLAEEPVAGQHLVDVGEEGRRYRNVSDAKEIGQPLRVSFALDGGMRQQ